MDCRKDESTPHSWIIVGFLTELFQSRLPDGQSVRCQLPITADRSEPEPDIAIVQGSHTEFRSRHPSGSDCRLVIEVADTSLAKDRSKAKIYRDPGVEEYWILNIADSCLERYVFAESELTATVLSGDEKISTMCSEAAITLELKQIFS